jgi:hypothetical protein
MEGGKEIPVSDSKRGKHEKPRASWLNWFNSNRKAVKALRRLPSIVTRERMLIGKERA